MSRIFPPASLVSAVGAMLHREWLLQWRQPADWLNPLCFFVMVVALFPLAIGPDKTTLHLLAPGVIWVAVLLSSLLAADHLFKQDYDEGYLDQLLISPQPFFILLSAKLSVQILLVGLPVILLSPLWGLLLFLDGHEIQILLVTLLLGVPVVSLISALGAAFTVGLRRGGVLLALLVMPFNIPILIFATSAVQAAGHHLPVLGYFAILAALLLMAITFLPLVIAAALRMLVT